MLLEFPKILLAILASLSICYYAAAIIAAHRFFSRRHPIPSGRRPPLSIMIPLCGADFRAYENYAALCRQEYPEFQIVFGVRDRADSSVGLVERLKSDFPETVIDLAVSSNEIGPNPKVNNLNNMLPLARHEMLVMLDSDIRVGTDFLSVIGSELTDTPGGVVTCLYRAGEAPGIASRLEAVGITTDFAPGVLIAEETAGIRFAFGATIAIEKTTLAGIGGFAAIAEYLADDYMMANLVHRAGGRVRLSSYVVETVLSRMSFSYFIGHQVRWARGIRACGRLGHAGAVVTHGTVLSSLYLALTGFAAAGWLLFFLVLGARLAAAWFIGVRCLGDSMLRRNFPMVILRDFFSFGFWCAAFLGNRVVWRQQVFEIDRAGKMTPSC